MSRRPTVRGLARLRTMAARPDGRSYLADEGGGRQAGSSWWTSMRALARLGLVQRARGRTGLLLAYELTEAGRALLASDAGLSG